MLRLRISTLTSEPNERDRHDASSIYLSDDHGNIIPIFDGPPIFDELVEWFRDNRASILSGEAPPFPVKKGESLTFAYVRALEAAPHSDADAADDDPDYLYEVQVDDWIRTHALRHGFYEHYIPDITCGLGVDGPEISCEPQPPSYDGYFSGDEWRWRYFPVDYVEFFEWLDSSHGSGHV